MTMRTVDLVEPVRLENPSVKIIDVAAASLAEVVRIMNTYCSNLIDGHNTRPHDIQRALSGKFDSDPCGHRGHQCTDIPTGPLNGGRSG